MRRSIAAWLGRVAIGVAAACSGNAGDAAVTPKVDAGAPVPEVAVVEAAVEAGADGGARPGAPAVPVITDGELDLSAEKIGELRVGLTAAEVEALLGKPTNKSSVIEEGATGDFVQTWSYPGQGLELGMAADDSKGTGQSLRWITAGDACTLPLPWGLKLGSTRAEVEAIYGEHHDDEMTTAEVFIAGSVYGGVFYTFTAGKVSTVFIGAGAE